MAERTELDPESTGVLWAALEGWPTGFSLTNTALDLVESPFRVAVVGSNLSLLALMV
ncbi:MAG TPA: hypothetical protein VIH91_11205 [Terriglobales bacterium]